MIAKKILSKKLTGFAKSAKAVYGEDPEQLVVKVEDVRKLLRCIGYDVYTGAKDLMSIEADRSWIRLEKKLK